MLSENDQASLMAQAKRREQRSKAAAAVVAPATAEPASELAWLAALVEFCSDSIISKRLDGTITSWNAAAEKMYGYAAAEVIGRSIELLVPEDRLDELRAMDERLARGERVPPLETVRLTKDGRRIDVALTMSPIFDRAGAVIGASGIARDVSARRRAEEALRRSQAELSDFVENCAVGLHWAGPDGTILWANRAVLDLLGYAREEYVGHHVAEFHADQDVVRDILECLGRHEQVTNREARLRCKDGGVRTVLVSSNVYAEDGRFVHTRCFIADIAERKQGEILIAGQKRALELIVQGAPLTAVLESLARTYEERSRHGGLASIQLLDRDGLRLRHGAAPSLPESYNQAIDGIAIGDAVGACGSAAYRLEPVIVADVATDPLAAHYRELALRHGLRACWSTPILARDHELLGTFAIYYREPRVPSAQARQAIEVLGRTAAIAIEARRAERQQRILIEELNHRVKNTLATAQSLASQTLRTSPPDQFAAAFRGRLAALASAHSLLAKSGWAGVRLHGLIRAQLGACGVADGRDVTIAGDDVALEPGAALALGLAVHELITNAAQHGALARPSGSIEVRSHVGAGPNGRRLVLSWRERGGPPVAPSPEHGFGLSLIERGLTYQLEGEVALEFRKDGLSCTIQLPLAAHAAPGG
jgi:PAS domain S-box-containing protein